MCMLFSFNKCPILLLLLMLLNCCSKHIPEGGTDVNPADMILPPTTGKESKIDAYMETFCTADTFSIKRLGYNKLYKIRNDGTKILLVSDSVFKDKFHIISVLDVKMSPSFKWLTVISDVEFRNGDLKTVDFLINLRNDSIVPDAEINKYSKSHFYDFRVIEGNEFVEAMNKQENGIVLVDLINFDHVR